MESLGLTESLHWRQVLLPREQNVLQPLIGPICDRRVDYQHQARLQPPPQPGNAILTLDHLARCVDEALPLPLALCLLPGCDDGDRDRKELGKRAGSSTEGQLDDGGWLAGGLGVLEVDGADNGVPVEVGEVCRGHTEQGATHAGVQARDALGRRDLGHGVPGPFVVHLVGFFVGLFGVGRLYLNLELRLDAGSPC